jgi:Ca2+-binding RTX toxin-like protein
LYGNAFDNYLNGGYGADDLSGLGGNDTFVFQAGQAQGDTVFEFQGNGDAAGDLLYFTGYGTAAEGASLTQLTASDWQITSADGLIVETITLSGAPSVNASDFLFV